MAPIKPNQNRLIITGKNKKASDYGTDMRTIEQWANARHLQAGSGITITNPDAPNPTISATGGGGSVMGHATLSSGPDFAEINSQAVFLGPTDQTNTYFSYQYLQSNSSGSAVFNTMASSWIVAVIAGEAVIIFPSFTAPTFTGGPLSVQFQLQTWSIAETNIAIYTATHSFTSGATYQLLNTDLTLVVNGGGDLHIVAGGGDTGTGVVSTAGGFYIAGVTVTISTPSPTTFT
jgi:hypothetical protein